MCAEPVSSPSRGGNFSFYPGCFGARLVGCIGPHLNLHLGERGVEVSLGLETSVWTLLRMDPETWVGADAGIEYNFSREIWVQYAELQVSVGGGMVRFRQFWDTEYYREGSIGAYVKAPYWGVI